MFKLRDTKLGFSLIEMMLLLLILSLLTAASIPILSRKHKKAPVKAFHGRYACFWNGDQLWQQQYSGENIIQNEGVERCTFEAPRKANYFYIQVIGAGGGGGGAGIIDPSQNSNMRIYNYYSNVASYYISTYYSSYSLSAFDLTEEEFNEYVGTKYVYLQVGSTEGQYCNRYTGQDRNNVPCEGYQYGTDEWHCVDKNDETLYYSEYTNLLQCEEAGHTWKEDWAMSDCPNVRYGRGYTYAYTNPIQVKYGLHSDYDTTWTDSYVWDSSSTNRNTGSFSGFRNARLATVDSTIPRALGGKGYKKCFTQQVLNASGQVVRTETIECAEASGGEGGEQGQCNEPSTENATCTCDPASIYLTPKDGEIVSGNAIEPTASQVCTGPDSNCLLSVTTSSPVFRRYEYYQKQQIKNGMGGLAGDYKTFFARNIDADIDILPGKGGKAGLSEVSGTNSYGKKGGDTRLGNMIASGGEGGQGDVSSGYLKLPTKGDEEYIEYHGIKIQKGDPGAVSPFRYEANLLGINNPLEGTVNYSDFGTGGDGAGVRNNCWEGYYKNVFQGAFNKEKNMNADIEYKPQYKWEDVNCKASGSEYPYTGSTSLTSGYYAGYYRNSVELESQPQDGYSGAIIISW